MTPTIRLSIAVLLMFSGLTTGCADKQFSFKNAAGSNANGNGGADDVDGTVRQDCTDGLQNATIPIKLLFVVDTSGSNAGTDGTDNNKVVRGQSIQEFFNLYKNKVNFSWDFTVFSGTTSSPLITGFTNNTATMQAAINNFLGITDNGNTPYIAALDLAYSHINADAARTAQTKWVIVFISDGMPVPDVALATIQGKVSSIVNLIPGQVTFNTVYYGPADATASGRLQSMATTGGGKFLNTNNSGRSFPIQDVISVPGTACR